MSTELYLLIAVFVLFMAFVGPTLVAIVRKVEGLGEFMLFNAICFVLPFGLLPLWVAAFAWPRREPDIWYVQHPPPRNS